MATNILPNPYVSVTSDAVDICYRNNNCHLPVKKIKKMYLKRKTGYWSNFAHSLLFMPDKSYKLYIRTDDNEISFTVKPFERQYFIGLISWIRNRAAGN
jgi:hypothetical protein